MSLRTAGLFKAVAAALEIREKKESGTEEKYSSEGGQQYRCQMVKSLFSHSGCIYQGTWQIYRNASKC
jgi:hypothetical protein